MIFNPVRDGGEKEYTITAGNGITTSATKLKPGRVFQATSSIGSRTPKMAFQDPDTEKWVTIKGLGRQSDFVMPCADVTITYQ